LLNLPGKEGKKEMQDETNNNNMELDYDAIDDNMELDEDDSNDEDGINDDNNYDNHENDDINDDNNNNDDDNNDHNNDDDDSDDDNTDDDSDNNETHNTFGKKKYCSYHGCSCTNCDENTIVKCLPKKPNLSKSSKVQNFNRKQYAINMKFIK
jgi:hypothetical protein